MFVRADAFDVWQGVHSGCGIEAGRTARGGEGKISCWKGNNFCGSREPSLYGLTSTVRCYGINDELFCINFINIFG